MGTHPLALKATLLLVASLTIMAGTIVAPSLPAIKLAFAETPHVDILSRMVLTLPAIFVAISAPLAGIVADRLGRKALLILSMLLYAMAGMSGLLAETLYGVLAGRAALGLAIGGIMTVSTTLVGDHFEGPERERYLGLQQAFTQFGGVAFVLTGGLVADLHWRAPFAIYAGSLLILPAVIVVLKDRVVQRTSLSGDDMSASIHWPRVALLCITVFLLNALFYTVPSQLPFFLQDNGVGRASTTGYAIALFNLAGALIGLWFGRFRARFQIFTILSGGLALMALGSALLSVASTLATTFCALAVMGFGLGLVMPSLMSLTIKLAPVHVRGRIVGVVTGSMFLGHFTSPLLSQPWIGWFGFSQMFRDIAIVFAAMGLIVMMTMGRRHIIDVRG